jgi:membrane protein DedA with SNARE-associated domain
MSDWIFSVIDSLGSLGVGLLVLLENLILPIPSEVILPLAGFRARDGALHPIAVWVSATAGSVIGAFILYGLGRWLGYDRLRRLAEKPWFIITSAADLHHGRELFRRHGSWVVVAARCVPVLRSLVSLPAGIMAMPVLKFAALTAIGASVWNAAFIAAGWLLADKWHQVDHYSGPIGTGVGIIVWRHSRSSPGASYTTMTTGRKVTQG